MMNLALGHPDDNGMPDWAFGVTSMEMPAQVHQVHLIEKAQRMPFHEVKVGRG